MTRLEKKWYLFLLDVAKFFAILGIHWPANVIIKYIMEGTNVGRLLKFKEETKCLNNR